MVRSIPAKAGITSQPTKKLSRFPGLHGEGSQRLRTSAANSGFLNSSVVYLLTYESFYFRR